MYSNVKELRLVIKEIINVIGEGLRLEICGTFYIYKFNKGKKIVNKFENINIIMFIGDRNIYYILPDEVSRFLDIREKRLYDINLAVYFIEGIENVNIIDVSVNRELYNVPGVFEKKVLQEFNCEKFVQWFYRNNEFTLLQLKLDCTKENGVTNSVYFNYQEDNLVRNQIFEDNDKSIVVYINSFEELKKMYVNVELVSIVYGYTNYTIGEYVINIKNLADISRSKFKFRVKR